MQSAVVEKAGRQEWEAAGQGAAAVRKQRKCCCPGSVLSSAQEPRLHDDEAQGGSSLHCQTCLEKLSKTHGGWGGHTDFHGDSESYHIGNEEEAFQGACL